MLPILVACGLASATCHRVSGDVLRPTIDGADLDRSSVNVELRAVAVGCGRVVDLDHLPGGDLLVTDQSGTVWRLGQTGDGRKWIQLDVATGGERGLLGLVVHPDFANNGRIYLNYTAKDGGRLVSRVAEWRDGGTGPRAHHLVYEVEQPFPNHNAGHLLFGPDGMLYIGWGDGGKAADPFLHGQNRASALGAILRLDVSQAPFAVPPDNPFVGQEGVLPEIWAFGLRNPWRYTFDPTGRLVVADVGQDAWEEVGFLTAGDNAGWNVREGRTCFRGAACSADGMREPFYVYPREDGSSVTGGVVPSSGPLAGRYVFGDYVSGRMWSLTLPEALGGTVTGASALGRFGVHPATFGTEPDGGLLVANHLDGTIYRVAAPRE